MSYSENTVNAIFALKAQGLSSRDIATRLGISKSGVNDCIARSKVEKVKPTKATQHYLFLDIETAPDIAATFSRFKANIGQDNVIRNGGFIISISWRWNNDPKAFSAVLTPEEACKGDDSKLVRIISNLISEADVIIGHFIKGFDLPVIKSRCVVNRLPPLKKVKVIDTCEIAKQMKFTSNKLGDLGVILGEGEKLAHSGITLWIDCMRGDKKALNQMADYNEQDVNLLYNIYQRLAAHDARPVNAALFVDTQEALCPVCGSNHVEKTGELIYTQVSAFEEVQCEDCGARSRTRKNVIPKEKRSELLL